MKAIAALTVAYAHSCSVGDNSSDDLLALFMKTVQPGMLPSSSCNDYG